VCISPSREQLDGKTAKAVPPEFYTEAMTNKLDKFGMTSKEGKNQFAVAYEELSDETKKKWINMALEAKPSYDVKFLLI